LERIYAAVVLDAINVKVRDGQVANRPVYAAIGVDLEGQKDILGMWFGDGGGESAKSWMAVLRSLYHDGMVRIGVTPSWAKLIDFETTLPSAVEELLRQREERQHG
jgi:transposase-like protein